MPKVSCQLHLKCIHIYMPCFFTAGALRVCEYLQLVHSGHHHASTAGCSLETVLGYNDRDSLCLLQTAVWQSCEGQTVPSEPQELYGAYLPSKGLIVSRVLQDGNILFTHPSYSTYSTEPLASSSFQVSQCDSAASTSSARPSASEASVTEASDREDSAVLPPSHRQTADEFAESFMSGQVLMFPAREEPETESDSEGHDVLTSELVPERHLLHQMPAIAKVSIVSGAGNKLSGVWPFPDNQCTVFDPTCRDTVITDAIFIGTLPPAATFQLFSSYISSRCLLCCLPCFSVHARQNCCGGCLLFPFL